MFANLQLEILKLNNSFPMLILDDKGKGNIFIGQLPFYHLNQINILLAPEIEQCEDD